MEEMEVASGASEENLQDHCDDDRKHNVGSQAWRQRVRKDEEH